jgi:hypothetical protein
MIAGKGVGGPNSDEGTATLVLYVYYNPSTEERVMVTATIRTPAGAERLVKK